jgi:hypothetical protein
MSAEPCLISELALAQPYAEERHKYDRYQNEVRNRQENVKRRWFHEIPTAAAGEDQSRSGYTADTEARL